MPVRRQTDRSQLRQTLQPHMQRLPSCSTALAMHSLGGCNFCCGCLGSSLSTALGKELRSWHGKMVCNRWLMEVHAASGVGQACPLQC